jgi:hypothetical protein
VRRRSRSRYYSSYGREKPRRFPSPLPYLVVLGLSIAGLFLFRTVTYTNLSGTVIHEYTGDPVAGIPVALMQVADPLATPAAPARLVTSATTGPDGKFDFQRIPARPAISITVAGFSPQVIEPGTKTNLAVTLIPNTLGGQVTDPAGNAIVGAYVRSEGAIARSGADGTYTLTDAPRQGNLIFKAPGYLSVITPYSATLSQDATLQPFAVRGIYMSADTVASPTKFRGLLDLVERTELNTVIIDVKADNSGTVLYNSNLDLVKQYDTAQAIIADLDETLAQLKRRNIYTIARLSVFWDQALTRAKPELALKSKSQAGQAWLDGYGKRWADPHNPLVWDYNIAIAEEVINRGFNEVQFDIAYFPSNGDLRDIDFGPNTGKPDVEAIGGFLDAAHARVSALGGYVSVDVLGLTPFVNDDMGVGQQFDELAKRVDYISPFVYPSDFSEGFLDFAKPAENPADVVANSIRNSVRRAGDGKRVRPWLQDFSREVPYDQIKVRAEIDAAQDSGAGGWMLFNFNNVYTEAALKSP